jgi:hypothetical protein
MVHREQEEMFLSRQASEFDPRQGATGQIEGLPGFRQSQFVTFRLPLFRREVAQVNDRQRQG